MQNAKWITSGYENDKNNSLPPEVFVKTFEVKQDVSNAVLSVSALGIYELYINGKKVGDSYFAPGYTDYNKYVQYQTYDITDYLCVGENRVEILVANGWYLGTLGNKNNRYGKKRAVIATVTFTDNSGKKMHLSTDESWSVSSETIVRFADFYNGETIDLNYGTQNRKYEKAKLYQDVVPKLKEHFGAFVTEDCRLSPVKLKNNIYDFGQNHAGVIHLVIKAEKGTKLTVKHAEILDSNGGLFTKNLRKAKATLSLVCGNDGINEFSPHFTYMGFRYAEVSSDLPFEIVKIESIVLTSQCKPIGKFSCSDKKLNRLQQNIEWSQRSNFIDIPTDCPQRDERMGWTGDIAVFAQTAAFNRDISKFMDKWLYDLKLSQRKNGALPVTVPENKTYEPVAYSLPTAIWGDSATMVPWAVYRAYGDKSVLFEQYESIKAYVNSELRIALLPSFLRHKKYLWDNNMFQYGDWCAPGEGFMKWKKKGRYLSTSFMANSVNILYQSALALGKSKDAEYYSEVLKKIKDAFAENFLKKDGTLVGDFQSNYACALYFDMIPEKHKAASAKRLSELVRENDYKIATGFAGTPYILFALADNGYVEDAYKLLQNEKCPGWLYCVNAGATTMWERWDALAEDGSIRADAIPDMISFNHYAYGAVGDFFYRRVLGLEPVKAGYEVFSVKPICGTLTSADGYLETKYGKIEISWKKSDGVFTLKVSVPDKTSCEIFMPSGDKYSVGCGNYEYTCRG